MYSSLENISRRPLEQFDRDNFPDFVTQLNEGLNSVELEFRRAQDEITGVPVMALVCVI